MGNGILLGDYLLSRRCYMFIEYATPAVWEEVLVTGISDRHYSGSVLERFLESRHKTV